MCYPTKGRGPEQPTQEVQGWAVCVCVCVDVTQVYFQLRQEAQLLKLGFEVKGHTYPREKLIISMKTT